MVVGVNRYTTDEPDRIDVFSLEAGARAAADGARALGSSPTRPGTLEVALDRVAQTAGGQDNLVPAIVEAVEAQATVGEISDAMRVVFGEFKEVAVD